MWPRAFTGCPSARIAAGANRPARDRDDVPDVPAWYKFIKVQASAPFTIETGLIHKSLRKSRCRGKNMRYAIVAAALCAAAVPAQAATTFDGTSSVSVRSHDPGLVVNATPLNFGPFTLDLDPSTGTIPKSRTVNIFGISTPEDAITLFEDTKAYDIAVTFNFANPLNVAGSPITGTTRGVFVLFADGYGRVKWEGPQTYTFGDGGSFRVALHNTDFALGGAVTNVAGDFKLLSESVSAVPEPATWAMMMLGFGAVGVAARRRRSGSARRRTAAA